MGKQLNILFNGSALERLLKRLKVLENYVHSNIIEMNRSRYFVVIGFGCANIAVLFKREFFLRFGEMGFQDEEGRKERGLGETINKVHLKEFVRMGVRELYFAYPNGSIYKIFMGDFLTKCHEWKNKEGCVVKSISIHNFQNIEKDKKC